MPGDAGDIQHPAAEVERDHLARPVGELVELPHRLDRGRDDCRQRPAVELPVPRHVVTVPVRVRDDQLVVRTRIRGQPVGDQPVDRRPEREHGAILRGPGVEQDRPLVTKDQIDERGLVAGRLGLPEQVGMRVIDVDLDRRLAAGTMAPVHVQVTSNRHRGREVDHAHTLAVSLRNRQTAPATKMSSHPTALTTHITSTFPPSSGAWTSWLRP